MRKFYSILAVAVLTALVAVSFRPAQAQVSGGYQRITGNKVTLAGIAQIVTAVSDRAITVKAGVLTSSATTAIQFYSGTTPVGAPLTLVAGVPLEIGSDILGKGFGSTVGVALSARSDGATVTFLLRIQED